MFANPAYVSLTQKPNRTWIGAKKWRKCASNSTHFGSATERRCSVPGGELNVERSHDDKYLTLGAARPRLEQL